MIAMDTMVSAVMMPPEEALAPAPDPRDTARPVSDASEVPPGAPLTLRDGTTLNVRAIRPDDAERLQAFHARLSREAVLLRFFRYFPILSDEAAHGLASVDYHERMALVATTGAGPNEQIRAVVRYARTVPRTAEVAFAVEDAWQGKGVAKALLLRLAGHARAQGFTTFVAIIRATNTRMLTLARHSGFPTSMRYDGGDVVAVIQIAADPQ